MLVRVQERPAQVPQRDEVPGLDWAWFEIRVRGELAAVAGQAVGGGECLQIIKPLRITPGTMRAFRDEDLPALRARARMHGARRIVSTARMQDAGFVKLTKAVGYDEHVQVAVMNLEG